MSKDAIPFIKDFRLNKFVIQVDTQDGCLLYNTATGSIVALDGEDDLYDSFEKLKEMKDYVPSAFDEISWVNELRAIRRTNSLKQVITGFTILTTTDCNARCFYCYEKGQAQKTMTDNTARDIANYILSVSSDSSVNLRWFGGEPLYNQRVIDLICNVLTEKGKKYESTMISNGLLFTDATIQKAKELWKLKSVQISLDGTKDIYQKAKAYKDLKGDEFDRVINSIKKLGDAGIRVSIRLNQSFYNTDDLLDLVDFLSMNFRGSKQILVYNSWLYEENELEDPLLEEAKYQQYIQLQNKLIDCGLFKNNSLKKRLRYYHCMADNDSSILVTPDGKIGLCEHYTDQHLVGSIYETSCDDIEMAKWKEPYPITPKCLECPIYPQCIRIKMCPVEREHCSLAECENKIDLIKIALLQKYESAQNEQD